MPANRKSAGRSRAKTPARAAAKASRKAGAGARKAAATGFVTNESLEVLEFLGDTSPYLDVTAGKADLRLQTMVSPLLYRALQLAVKEAVAAGTPRRAAKCLLLGERPKHVAIEVSRFENRPNGVRYRILLEDLDAPFRDGGRREQQPKAAPADPPEVARLRQELAATKETFRAIVAEQQRRHKTTLAQLAAAHEKSEAFAAELEVTHTELEAAHAELQTHAEELRTALEESRHLAAFNTALVDTLRALVVVLDRKGRIVRFNRSCQAVTGYAFEEVEGRHVWDFLLLPGEAKGVRQTFSHLRTGQGPNTFENHWVTKQGKRRLISWSNVALGDDDGTVRFVIGTGIDITDQQRMSETIDRNRNELRQLTTRLTARHEEEYKHLSRELHDVFSQRLTMLGMHVSDLEQSLPAAGVGNGQSLGKIGAEISQLASQIHGISRRLHPAILDDLGLAAALQNECLAFAREHGIEASCQAKGQGDGLPAEIALCLYRVAQASLNNIRQHAQAGRVEMRLACTREQASLWIEDFGIGFDPIEVRGKGGLGLVSMEERVRAVGGELSIDSAPGKGARIAVRIPLKKSPGSKVKQ